MHLHAIDTTLYTSTRVLESGRRWPGGEGQGRSAQADEHAVEPAQDLEGLLGLGLESGEARHEHDGRVLVEACRGE